MSRIIVSCPRCSTRHSAPASLAGKKVRCKNDTCRHTFELQATPGPARGSTPGGASGPTAGTVRTADTGDKVPLLWEPGDVLLGLYKVEGVLGEGGMGKVYKVRHQGWNVDLAVKSIRPQLLQQPGAVDGFKREAETWVNLGLHPHTVSCFYVRRLGGLPRVFAEYVAGGSLKEWIDSGKLYAGGPGRALPRILDIAIQLAWGLHHAHEQGLVHQDVKPANVMLTPDGTAKVTDFGLAKAQGVAGAAAAAAGQSILVSAGGMTLAYCSPEQAEGQKLTRKTDVWSWGLSVLEMFAGDVTWGHGAAAAEALEEYLAAGVREPHLPRMPHGLAVLLGRCFAACLDDRPGTMLQVVPALQALYRQAAGRDYPRTQPNPSQAVAATLNNRAISLLDLGREEEAVRCWRRAIAADAAHLEAVVNLGRWEWAHGRIDDVEYFKRLADLGTVHGGRPDYAAALAAASRERGDPAADFIHRFDFPDTVRALACDPGGVYALAVGTGRAIRMLDPTSRAGPIDAWQAPGIVYDLYAVAVSPDGGLLVTGESGYKVTVSRIHHGPPGTVARLEAEPDRGVQNAGSFGTCALAFTRDGSLLATGYLGDPFHRGPQPIRVWETTTWCEVREIEGHPESVYALAFTPDGRYLISGGAGPDDGVLKVWEIGEVEPARLGTAEGGLSLWDVPSVPCRTLLGHAGPVYAVAILADGLALSGGADGMVRLWTLEKDQSVRVFRGHVGPVRALYPHASGRWFASAGDDGTVKLWDPASGKCLRTLTGHDGPVYGLAGWGEHLLSASKDRTVRLWRPALGTEAVGPYLLAEPASSNREQENDAAVRELLERADRAAVAGNHSAGYAHLRAAQAIPGRERSPAVLDRISRITRGTRRAGVRAAWPVLTFTTHAAPITSAVWTPDGRTVVSSDRTGHVHLWEANSGQHLRTLAGADPGPTAVAVSGDGAFVAGGHKPRSSMGDWRKPTLHVWHLETGELLHDFGGHKHGVSGLTFLGDGGFLLTAAWEPDGAGKGHMLTLWDISSGKTVAHFTGHDGPVEAVAAATDGRRFVSVGTDRTVRLWERKGADPVWIGQGHTNIVFASDLSADGRVAVTGDADETVRVWHVARGAVGWVRTEHTATVHAAALTPDGAFAASGGDDQLILLWDVRTGEVAHRLVGHKDGITTLRFSPDGRYLLSGGYDKTARVWELDWSWDFTPTIEGELQ